MAEALILFGEERRLWMMAGARGLPMAPSLEFKFSVSWVVFCVF
jgi:hypothetical protein